MKNLNKNSIVGIISIGLIILVAAFFITGTETHVVSQQGSKVTYGELDKVRKNEEVRSRFQREKVHVENFKKAPQIKETYQISEPKNEAGLRLEASVGAAAKDIAESDLQGMAVQSLENRINQKLLNEQKAAQMSALQKKLFADEYKKKALSMGYQVELNDKLEVIKVQKVESAPTAVKSNPVIDVDSMEEEEESYE